MCMHMLCSMQQQGHGNPSGMGGMVSLSSRMQSWPQDTCFTGHQPFTFVCIVVPASKNPG